MESENIFKNGSGTFLMAATVILTSLSTFKTVSWNLAAAFIKTGNGTSISLPSRGRMIALLEQWTLKYFQFAR